MRLSPLDEVIATADRALRSVAANPAAARPYPDATVARNGDEMRPEERADSAALMRVNHVGEICAQALYEAQTLGATDPALREAFATAAREEVDHLAWTARRIEELGGRTSLLNPLWYASAFAIGLGAARFGDRVSLGFMAETEAQVEQHLQGHLEQLPISDRASRAVIEQMRADEAHHGQSARAMGGVELPLPVRLAMRLAAKVMTRTAHYI